MTISGYRNLDDFFNKFFRKVVDHIGHKDNDQNSYSMREQPCYKLASMFSHVFSVVASIVVSSGGGWCC